MFRQCITEFVLNIYISSHISKLCSIKKIINLISRKDQLEVGSHSTVDLPLFEFTCLVYMSIEFETHLKLITYFTKQFLILF